jgi:hypothetical protein
MNFNNPFLPYYNPGLNLNQALSPIAPWTLPVGYTYPSMHYQPQMAIPYQQTPSLNSLNPLSPMMIHQQNNFYAPNYPSHNQRSINPSL